MNPRIAIYPTSANPPTKGHADILLRTSQQFDFVIWAAAFNPEKGYSFSTKQRIEMMLEYINYYNLKNVKVESFNGSTVRFAQKLNAKTIVKGLRSLEDFEGEFQQAVANSGIDESIETFCLFGKPELFAVSSTLVRELSFLGEDIEKYVIPNVANIIYKIIKQFKEN